MRDLIQTFTHPAGAGNLERRSFLSAVALAIVGLAAPGWIAVIAGTAGLVLVAIAFVCQHARTHWPRYDRLTRDVWTGHVTRTRGRRLPPRLSRPPKMPRNPDAAQLAIIRIAPGVAETPTIYEQRAAGDAPLYRRPDGDPADA